jgi:hypothetical protein
MILDKMLDSYFVFLKRGILILRKYGKKLRTLVELLGLIQMMKITSLKFICVSNSNPNRITGFRTPGKIYDVKITEDLDSDFEQTTWIDDSGLELLFFFNDKDFLPIDEWRNLQIDKLQI